MSIECGLSEACVALVALYNGENLRACDVPRYAWPDLIRVITTPQGLPRPYDVQSRMDALVKSINSEEE